MPSLLAASGNDHFLHSECCLFTAQSAGFVPAANHHHKSLYLLKNIFISGQFPSVLNLTKRRAMSYWQQNCCDKSLQFFIRWNAKIFVANTPKLNGNLEANLYCWISANPEPPKINYLAVARYLQPAYLKRLMQNGFYKIAFLKKCYEFNQSID